MSDIDKTFYKNMIEKSKKYNKQLKYRFTYGPCAANLYYIDNGINYVLTFDYAMSSIYFSGLTNILEIDLNDIDYCNIINLEFKKKEIFKNMLKEIYNRTKDFTFSNIPKLIEKIKILL